MRFLTLVLSIFLLTPMLATAATVTMDEGTNTIPFRAAAGETNTIEGSGALTSNLLSFGISNDLGAFNDGNDGQLWLEFGLNASGTNVSLYQIVTFAVDGFGQYFLSDSGVLFLSSTPTYGIDLNFNANGPDQLVEVTLYTTDGDVPNGGSWSMFSEYIGPPLVDTGGGGGTNVVPLPAAAWLLLGGLGGLYAVGRRRKLA